MTDRALRIQRLRRRVAVAAVATFAAAFGGVTATGQMGTSDAAPAATVEDTDTDASAATGIVTTTAAAPSTMTTRQS
jgi:hypothetical protein